MTYKNPSELLNTIIQKALTSGASAADALMVESASVSLNVHQAKLEKLERSESKDLGLRVFVGNRQAMVSSSDQSPEALERLVDKALTMAKNVPEDPFSGLANPEFLAKSFQEMDLVDQNEPSTQLLTERAQRVENAALTVKGVMKAEDATAYWSSNRFCLATSAGFSGEYRSTSQGFSVTALAEGKTGMERDYDFSHAIHGEDLESPEEIGKRAGEYAVRRLDSRRVKTQKIPVIFDPRISKSFLGYLASAISGPSIARGTSFLKDKLHQAVFSKNITIVDDPFILRGLRSLPFDGEGVLPQKRKIIDQGILTTWLLDSRSARQLNVTTTGHASRGTSSPPSPSPHNFYLEAGPKTVAELFNQVKQGFYVTEMLGSGVNSVTGDYSRGASGFWIENGVLSYPVSEVTLSGNLLDIFQNIEAANDLKLRNGIDAPTVLVDGLTLAGT